MAEVDLGSARAAEVRRIEASGGAGQYRGEHLQSRAVYVDSQIWTEADKSPGHSVASVDASGRARTTVDDSARVGFDCSPPDTAYVLVRALDCGATPPWKQPWKQQLRTEVVSGRSHPSAFQL